MNRFLKITLPALVALGFCAPAHAAENEVTLHMKGGNFEPATLEVPANQKIHLIVQNDESAQTEFESYELNQEHKIEAGQSTDMYIGPLDAGTYPIFDDNNPDAKGQIVAK